MYNVHPDEPLPPHYRLSDPTSNILKCIEIKLSAHTHNVNRTTLLGLNRGTQTFEPRN